MHILFFKVRFINAFLLLYINVNVNASNSSSFFLPDSCSSVLLERALDT